MYLVVDGSIAVCRGLVPLLSKGSIEQIEVLQDGTIAFDCPPILNSDRFILHFTGANNCETGRCAHRSNDRGFGHRM